MRCHLTLDPIIMCPYMLVFFHPPSHRVDCSPSVRWACSVIGAAGGDLFPSFPSVAAVCRWAARGAMPSCHLSDRVQFPGHLFPSITESEEKKGEWWRLWYGSSGYRGLLLRRCLELLPRISIGAYFKGSYQDLIILLLSTRGSVPMSLSFTNKVLLLRWSYSVQTWHFKHDWLFALPPKRKTRFPWIHWCNTLDTDWKDELRIGRNIVLYPGISFVYFGMERKLQQSRHSATNSPEWIMSLQFQKSHSHVKVSFISYGAIQFHKLFNPGPPAFCIRNSSWYLNDIFNQHYGWIVERG